MAYHLFDEAIDWYDGVTRICIGVSRSVIGLDAAEFRARVETACWTLKSQSQPQPIDAALVAIDDDYFVFWDHRPDASIDAREHLDAFAQCSRVVMQTQATDANANASFVDRWRGFDVKGGECYRMTFERRTLFPW